MSHGRANGLFHLKILFPLWQFFWIFHTEGGWILNGTAHCVISSKFEVIAIKLMAQAVKDSARLLLSPTIGLSTLKCYQSTWIQHLLPLYHLWLKIDTAQHSTTAVPSWKHTYSTTATGQVQHHGQVTAALYSCLGLWCYNAILINFGNNSVLPFTHSLTLTLIPNPNANHNPNPNPNPNHNPNPNPESVWCVGYSGVMPNFACIDLIGPFISIFLNYYFSTTLNSVLWHFLFIPRFSHLF